MTEPKPRTPWSGRKVTSARTYWAARLAQGPRPCALCGGPVSAKDRWVVEHLVERSRGGSVTDRNNQGVSHKSCSDRSGGQMGAARTNANRPATITRLDSARSRGLRGI